MRLMVDPSAKPVAHHKPIPVPIYWQKDVKCDLDRDTRLRVVAPVPIGTPVRWCHQMVITAKKNGKPRRTVNLQALNQHATRETHHTQSPFHQVRDIPPNTYKTVFDAWNGYHSIPLDERDRHLTTFITPWGITGVSQSCKDTPLQVMPILAGLMKLLHTYRRRRK